MLMEEFFEAWVETIMARVARQIGGLCEVVESTKRLFPINWDPPI